MMTAFGVFAIVVGGVAVIGGVVAWLQVRRESNRRFSPSCWTVQFHSMPGTWAIHDPKDKVHRYCANGQQQAIDQATLLAFNEKANVRWYDRDGCLQGGCDYDEQSNCMRGIGPTLSRLKPLPQTHQIPQRMDRLLADLDKSDKRRKKGRRS